MFQTLYFPPVIYVYVYNVHICSANYALYTWGSGKYISSALSSGSDGSSSSNGRGKPVTNHLSLSLSLCMYICRYIWKTRTW